MAICNNDVRRAPHPGRGRGGPACRAATLTDRARRSLPPALPRLLLLEAEFELHRLGAEADWLTRVVDDLDQGRLTWPAGPSTMVNIEELITP